MTLHISLSRCRCKPAVFNILNSSDGPTLDDVHRILPSKGPDSSKYSEDLIRFMIAQFAHCRAQ